jgi:transcriptional regulator with XRE-family HTH domain
MTISVDGRVGWALRTRRGRSGVSQARAAREIDVARQRLSATESGDSARGLAHESLRRLDDLMGADGELLHLRNRLRRLRAPETRLDLLTAEERLDLNHAVRNGEDVPRDQALYVDAFELVAAGADTRTDRRARRTARALVDELQLVSTLANHFVLGGLQLLADSAEPMLLELAFDEGNPSPWRSLRAFSALRTDAHPRQLQLLRMLDLRTDAGQNLKRHGAALSAFDDMGTRIGSRAIELRPLAEEPSCYPESRTCALLLACGPQGYGDDHRGIRRFLDHLRGDIEMLEGTASAVRCAVAAEAPVAMRVRLGSTEQRLWTVLGDSGFPDDEVTTTIVREFIGSPTERVRNAAAFCLRAAGLHVDLAEVLRAVVDGASWDVQCYLLRNAGMLNVASLAPALIAYRNRSNAFVRANAAWGLSRLLTPSHLPAAQAWLDAELAAEVVASDVVAALRQAVASVRS